MYDEIDLCQHTGKDCAHITSTRTLRHSRFASMSQRLQSLLNTLEILYLDNFTESTGSYRIFIWNVSTSSECRGFYITCHVLDIIDKEPSSQSFPISSRFYYLDSFSFSVTRCQETLNIFENGRIYEEKGLVVGHGQALKDSFFLGGEFTLSCRGRSL